MRYLSLTGVNFAGKPYASFCARWRTVAAPSESPQLTSIQGARDDLFGQKPSHASPGACCPHLSSQPFTSSVLKLCIFGTCGKEKRAYLCLPMPLFFPRHALPPLFFFTHRCIVFPPQLMDNREAAAALRESIRVNGKAEAASDEEGDSGEEGEDAPPPIKVLF